MLEKVFLEAYIKEVDVLVYKAKNLDICFKFCKGLEVLYQYVSPEELDEVEREKYTLLYGSLEDRLMASIDYVLGAWRRA